MRRQNLNCGDYDTFFDVIFGFKLVTSLVILWCIFNLWVAKTLFTHNATYVHLLITENLEIGTQFCYFRKQLRNFIVLYFQNFKYVILNGYLDLIHIVYVFLWFHFCNSSLLVPKNGHSTIVTPYITLFLKFWVLL